MSLCLENKDSQLSSLRRSCRIGYIFRGSPLSYLDTMCQTPVSAPRTVSQDYGFGLSSRLHFGKRSSFACISSCIDIARSVLPAKAV